MPFIGTTITALPRPVVRSAYRALKARHFLNVELHGLDLMDDRDEVPDALARRQPGLRVPRAEKMRRLREVLSWIVSDYETVTLAAAAARFRAN
jgi:hypothetical protein